MSCYKYGNKSSTSHKQTCSDLDLTWEGIVRNDKTYFKHHKKIERKKKITHTHTHIYIYIKKQNGREKKEI